MFRQYKTFILGAVITILCIGNIVFAWNFNKVKGELTRAINSNLVLKRQNSTYRQGLGEKEQELEAKNTDLAKAQTDLTQASKELEAKKAELTAKINDLTQAQKKIDDQKSQLEANSSELTKLRNRPPLFSFQVKATGISDVEAKKAAIKQIVTDAYDTISEIYGKPYLLHSVTITFVDSFSNSLANGEIVITNSQQGLDLDIHLKDFDRNNFNDVNSVIHEVIHSFHGLAALEPTAFEEGVTVAATDAVMKKMIAAGSIPSFSPLYIRLTENQFSDLQASLSIPRNADSFYSSDHVADYYQVLGYAWYSLYKNDSNFFKSFNEKIYGQKNAGVEITEQLVLDTVKSVAPNTALTGAAWQLH